MEKKGYDFKFYIALVVCILFSMISFMQSLINLSLYRKKKEGDMPFCSGMQLPSKFSIPKMLISPVRDQGNRGTCWIFQIIGILEAQYKIQGVERGYLKENEHLRLSQEGLGVLMVRHCLREPESIECELSNRLLNTTTGGNIDEFLSFIQKWPNITHSIIPSHCCPYQQKPENEMVCPNLDKCIEQNPLKFQVLQTFSTTNIGDIKQRLYETSVPHALSITMPVQKYFFPCYPGAENNRSCINEEFICARNKSKFCYPKYYKLFKPSYVDFIFQSVGKTVPGTPHAMLVVGYNDNFIVKRSAKFSYVPSPVGGFIVKNSWGNRGHSYEYLYGDITDDQEDMLCPNKEDVFKWIPITFECANRTRSITQCSQDIKQYRGNKIAKSGDELICINATHCDENSTYALLRESEKSVNPLISWSDEGVPLATLIKMHPIPETKLITTLPIQHLYYAVRLKTFGEIENDPRCGYVFVSYDVIEDTLRMRDGYKHGVFSVAGMRVEWDDSSYYQSGSSGNYTNIINSMEKYETLEPDSPFQHL